MVEHQKHSIARRFEPQVLGPICGPIQGVGKEISQHLQIKTTKKPQSSSHISCFAFEVGLL